MRAILRRRSTIKAAAAAAINAKTPNVTPTPMPAFTPWLRPLLPLEFVPAVDFAEGVEDVVDVGLMLAVVPVLAADEVPVF